MVGRGMLFVKDQGDPLEFRDQPIHLVGGFGGFPADAAHGTAGVAAGFLALETEHFFAHGILLSG